MGDQVAIFRPHGRIAQVDSPERLLTAPADSYVESFLGFDRGIRRLSFLAASGLSLDDTAGDQRQHARLGAPTGAAQWRTLAAGHRCRPETTRLGGQRRSAVAAEGGHRG